MFLETKISTEKVDFLLDTLFKLTRFLSLRRHAFRSSSWTAVAACDSWPQEGDTQLACAKHGETLAARKLARDGVQCRAAAELVE